MAELYPLNQERGGQLEEVHRKWLFDRTPYVGGIWFHIYISPKNVDGRKNTRLAFGGQYNYSYEFETEQYGFKQIVIDGKEGIVHDRIYPSGSGVKTLGNIYIDIEPRSDGTFADEIIYKYTCISHNKIAERYNLTSHIPKIFYNDPVATINSITYDRTQKSLTYNLTYGHDKYFVENEVGFRAAAGNLSYIRTIFANGDTWSQPLRTDRAGDILTNNKIITDENRHIKAGETINYEYVIYATNGRKKTVKGSYQIPATVHNIKIGDMNLVENSAATKLPYELINNEGAKNFAVPGVTFSGNNDYVASIDQNGIVTPHHSGSVTFTIRSHDDVGGNITRSKTFYIRAVGGFPFDTNVEHTDYLSAEIANRLIIACQMVATKQKITIEDITTFRGYTTKIREVRDVVYKINSNVKTIANVKSISYDAQKLTFSETNQNEEWYRMVNEWLRLMPLFKPYA